MCQCFGGTFIPTIGLHYICQKFFPYQKNAYSTSIMHLKCFPSTEICVKAMIQRQSDVKTAAHLKQMQELLPHTVEQYGGFRHFRRNHELLYRYQFIYQKLSILQLGLF